MFTKKIISLFILVLALLVLTPFSAQAAPIIDLPVTVTQPDGTTLNLFASGDEYYNWLHDENGYTVIQDPVTGDYVYADLVDGKLVPTQYVVGVADPASTGLRPYLNISPEQKEQIRQAFLDKTRQMAGDIQDAPNTGTINNLVIFVRFSDESEFTDTTSIYTDMLNDATAGANSLRNYYREVSYNTLTVNSTFLPTPGTTILSYQDANPRSYYQPHHAVTNPGGYTNDRTLREHTLLRDAIAHVDSLGQFPGGASIDSDSDGIVDSLTFVVSGSPGGWSELLWPHQWSLFSYTVTINSKAVEGYQFQLQSAINTGVLAHETFHVLGAPDLYHYTSNGIQPVGGWDVMEFNANPPQHMSCYMKFKYGGWIASLPELSTAGSYTLNPLTSSTNNCRKIASPYSATEYFVVEYRRGTGSTFESSLPGDGLLVYRINTLATGNANGPPDEVYVYRPGGTTSINGTVNNANFSNNVGRTAINDGTNPSSFLSNGGPGGLNLCNVGAVGATISFDICPGSVFAISGNAGTAGVTLSYTDGTPKTATSTGTGSYTLVVSSGWSGTVTPSKTDYTFTPSSRPYTNVASNQTSQNYTASGPTNLLQDPGFEASSPNPYWTESSTNFGTPLCLVATCGSGGIAAPQTGSGWGWFGGIAADETALVAQTVTIPTGTATLEFSLWIGAAAAGSDAADVFTAKVDGATVFSTNATQIDSYPSYTLVSLDVSAYANNASHTITFSSVTTGQAVSFNLDDVALLSIPTLPGAFAKSSPANGAANQSTSPTLTWASSADVTSYEYCYDTSNDNSCSNWTSNGTSTSKALSGLTAGTTYYWHVRANNAGGTTYSNGSSTAFWSFATVPNPPGAFNKTGPSNGATNQSLSPTLTWAASSGATSYEYCYDTTNDNSCSTWTSNGNLTSKALSGLTTSTTYYWHVRANNAGGTTYSNANAFWSFTTVPNPPGAFNKTAPATGAINQSPGPTLSWGSSTGATSYEYCYDTSNDNACSPWTSNGNLTSKALSGLTTSTTYYWHVRAINTGGTTYSNGSSTVFWSFTTIPDPPGAFNKTSPSNGAINQPTSLNLTWGASTGATSYEYCYDTSNDNDCSTWTSNGNLTSKALSNLNAGTTYYWHVRAINPGGTTYSNGNSSTAFWNFKTQGVAVGDSYEPDNTSPLAKSIASGVPQNHSIFPSTDVDWVKFQLATPSAVTLETNGVPGHDTRMWLYNSSLAQILFNDDRNIDAGDLYSYISTCDLAPLAAGTYYVKVDEYENNAEIPSYTLSFNTGTCVNIDIGGNSQGSYLVPKGGSTRQSFAAMNDGPVKLASTNAAPIIGAERLIYKVNGVLTSYSELMGLPENQLDNVYWLPWYNNFGLDTQLRFANVSGATATVNVTIGGVPVAGNPFILQPGESTRESFAGVNAGPVKISSNVNIVAAERVIYKVNGIPTSFTELVAMPEIQLDNIYWLPWYNSLGLDTELRIANTTNVPGTVHITIGGIEMGTGYNLPAGGTLRKSFPGLNSGPVKIESDVNIVAAERVIYKVNNVLTSFTEMMALPEIQLDNIYWLPWYNNLGLDTQLRLANVGSLPATVHVYIGGQEMGTGYSLDPGESTRLAFAGVNDGPVQIVSDQNIVVAQRVIYKVNNVPTSFTEMMGLPDSQLDNVYWLPWYNNLGLDSQLRFGVP